MSPLHPHWHTTDDDEQPVKITAVKTQTAAGKVQAAPTVPRARRSPAAIIGILMFLGIGFALFQGVNGLQGQASANETEIIISNTGVVPPIVTVQPGKTIVWKNESGIPHIFSSKTLPTQNGEEFLTTALFPQATYEYVVPANAPAGTHEYISTTSAQVSGQIIITSGTAAAPAPVNTAPTTPQRDIQYTMPEQNTPTSVPAQQPQATDTMPPAEDVTGTIPQNPHTVGSGEVPIPVRPLPGTTTPQPAYTGSVTQHLPSSQPQTGIGAWTVGMMAGLSLLVVTRKAVRGF